MASVVKSPTSPSRATQNMTTSSSEAGVASTKPLDIADDDDLDPAAFLQSVRELSAKREREDNERFRKLEEEIEKGRQERLARRAEYARSISPEKRDSVAQPSTRSPRGLPNRPSSVVAPQNFNTSISISTPKSTSASTVTPTTKSPSGVEEVPEFSGFGSAKKASAPATPTPNKTMASISPAPAPKPSPSAAMPGRSGTLKWQQRPSSRIGVARPLSMIAVESVPVEKRTDTEDASREEIAKSLSTRDPSWFRQTQDRGIGNAALRKNADEVGAGDDIARTSRMGLPGMAIGSTGTATPRSSTSSTNATSTVGGLATASSAANSLEGRHALRMDRSPSPTKELGGFVQSALMKRNNSITKRSTASQGPSIDRTASLRSGFGGLQGSHSMPKLDQPNEPTTVSTDSMARPASSMNLTGIGHSRAKSITAYTVNELDRPPSAPASPGKRWSPNKSSWIESALTAKPDSRPASPTKNSQPSWMSNLAKANAAKASAETSAAATPVRSSTPVFIKDEKLVAEPESTATATTEITTALKPIVSASESAQDIPKPRPAPLSKPQISPKPQLDFRSNLKARAATEPVPKEQPEFLSRFGTLRKTTTEKYIAPDTLKHNILRGKAGLSVTDGPQQNERRDEFKDSLLATKEQLRQDRLEGPTHDNKTAAPITPAKPEALAKREAMARGGAVRPSSPEKEKQVTPEALKWHLTIRSKPPAPIPATETMRNDIAKAEPVIKPTSFSSQLAGLLARGPAPSSVSEEKSATRQAKVLADTNSSGVEASSGLQDVRKGRAKGPKRRKAGTTMTTTADEKHDVKTVLSDSVETPERPQSVASRTAAFSRPLSESRPKLSPKPVISTKPTTMLKDHAHLGWDEDRTESSAVPEFRDLTKLTMAEIASDMDEDKENKTHAGIVSPPMPSPSLRDEEAALRSAKLLASAPRSPAFSGLGISNGPPKPAKSSRSVSGQLQEASLNKVFQRLPSFRRDSASGTINTPRSSRIDARAIFAQKPVLLHRGRTVRKILYRLGNGGKLSIVQPRDEYTVSEENIYIFVHVYMRVRGNMATDVYTWIGRRAAPADHYDLKVAQRTITSEHKSATLCTIQQGRETEEFLAAVGGILITRKSSKQSAEPYMLCGRKHQSHLVFDEVVCKPTSLCSAFAYVIWNPVTVSEDVIYLWRGLHYSPEEMSAARLVAMDLSSSGNVIEVVDGDEPTEFWKLFGDWPMREDALSCPEALRCKFEAGNDYNVRLYRILRRESRPGFFTSMLSRRPSWGSRSPAPLEVEVKYEAEDVSPFIQDDLDAEGVYVLDTYARLDVLIGPLSSATSSDDGLYQHVLEFVKDYAGLCVEAGRPRPQCYIVRGGVPIHMPFIFRHWRNEHGLWATAGLMAGLLQDKTDVQCMILQDALATLQEKTVLEEDGAPGMIMPSAEGATPTIQLNS